MVKKAILIRNAAATDFGGGERVPVFLARELAAFDVQALILSRSEKLLAFAKAENVAHQKSWWWSRQDWSGKNALLFPTYVLWQIILYAYYLSIFAKHKPTTVHIQSKDDFIAGSLAARSLGIQVLWSDYADLKHIWLNHSVWYKNPVGKLVYWAARFAHTIVVVSNNDRSDIAQHIPNGAIKDKLTVIYNGAFDQYSPTKKNKLFTIVSTGRLVTDKGIGELIRAFKTFHTEFPDSQLQLIGDGPEGEKFKTLAKSVDGIHFLGHKTNPLEYVATADVFVLPTYHEGFSLALVEACMEKVAIITTNVGGNPEIITHEKNGLLVTVKSDDELYNAMKRLYVDELLRKKISERARKEYVASFNFKDIVEHKFVPLYKGVWQ